ncbi:MAG: ABC transporter ATP-binding protein [Candidatus Dormibacteraceae bacterium]
MKATATPGESSGQGYAIELVGVAKRYGASVALTDVNLEIEPGEFLVLLGPSGCGKSTILKIIAGLEDASEGDVYINGRLANYIRPKQRDVAMVFQNYALYPHMTVETNLGFPLKMRGQPKEAVNTKISDIAHLLELEQQLKKYPEQLSGGQRQRVALGRAIIREPTAFLMDEPLSNLDALLRVQMRSELLNLHRRLGRTTLYVTHDQVEAMTMATRIVVLRLGVIQQVGTTGEVYGQPANTFVATFVGSPQMNLFSGRVERHADDAHFVAPGPVTVRFDGAVPGELEAATLGIRPEDVALVAPSDPAAIPAGVEIVEAVGAEKYLAVVLAEGGRAMIRVSAKSQVREGERIYMRFPPEALHLFDSDGIRVPLVREADSALAGP